MLTSGSAHCRRAWAGGSLSSAYCDEFDDEHHLVFECTAFKFLQADNQHLLGPEVAFDMRRFFAHRDQQAVVRFVLACLRVIEAEHDDGL